MIRRAWGWSALDKRRKPQLARPTPADALYGTHMKRHAALIPLSHDHHDILVIAQGLILGRSKAPRSTWPTDKQAQADRVVLFFAQSLQPHFDLEETRLFPAVVSRLPDQQALVTALTDEHETLRAHVQALPRHATAELHTRLPQLGELLVKHVRREERILFETIQRRLPADELEALGVQLRRRPVEAASCTL